MRKPSPFICPKCGSAASHLEPSGFRRCERVTCNYLGRNERFRGGGPDKLIPEDPYKYHEYGRRLAIRYEGDD